MEYASNINLSCARVSGFLFSFSSATPETWRRRRSSKKYACNSGLPPDANSAPNAICRSVSCRNLAMAKASIHCKRDGLLSACVITRRIHSDLPAELLDSQQTNQAIEAIRTAPKPSGAHLVPVPIWMASVVKLSLPMAMSASSGRSINFNASASDNCVVGGLDLTLRWRLEV